MPAFDVRPPSESSPTRQRLGVVLDPPSVRSDDDALEPAPPAQTATYRAVASSSDRGGRQPTKVAGMGVGPRSCDLGSRPGRAASATGGPHPHRRDARRLSLAERIDVSTRGGAMSAQADGDPWLVDSGCSMRVIRRDGQPLLVVAEGELDVTSTPALESLLRTAYGDHGRVHLDLSGVTFAGVSVLEMLQRVGGVVVVASGQPVNRLFQLAALDRTGPALT